MSKPILQYKETEEHKAKETLYPTDNSKLEADILLELRGVQPTNPSKWNDTLRQEAGKAVEMQMIKVLKQNGVIDELYDQDNLPSTKIERMGVPISMRFDAQAKESTLKLDSTIFPQGQEIKITKGEPIEIKTINNNNSFDIQKYIEGMPRESYITQIAIYMDALNKDIGHLFASTIDGLNYFWFQVKHIGNLIFQADKITIDLNKVYERYAKIWKKYKENVEPDWFEEIYKLPVEQVNWTSLSSTKITEARNNRRVIGSENSWKINYSPYRDLILEKQGINQKGYTESEILKIKELTKGFSKK